jgi:hypothetical protein
LIFLHGVALLADFPFSQTEIAMPTDTFSSTSDSPIAPAQDCFNIAPDDIGELPKVTKALYIGSGGDVVVRAARADSAVVFRNVPSGYILDVRAIAVRASGTTATDLIGLA